MSHVFIAMKYRSILSLDPSTSPSPGASSQEEEAGTTSSSSSGGRLPKIDAISHRLQEISFSRFYP